MTSKLRLLILSDLHAIIDKEEDKDSHLLFTNGESSYGETFIRYIKELNKEFDILICAGDLTNQGGHEAFSQSWKFLHKIKRKLNIDHILCVPGNHDHQSHPEANAYNPVLMLQEATPPFPLSCHATNTQFWAWHWCHYENPKLNTNAILLNTSAYHGRRDPSIKFEVRQ